MALRLRAEMSLIRRHRLKAQCHAAHGNARVAFAIAAQVSRSDSV
jgi:hypothetical protein